ncbi:MAG: CPBP family intramembrane metalloprotease [Deltaproteobacteria bacterium]|nr:CPBP family intramembrane metalloprotease [Deltaproteobacteria bacterium]
MTVLDSSKKSLLKEVAIAVTLLGFLIALVAKTAPLLGLESIVTAMAGIILIFIPVFILDRKGKPYKKYGLTFSSPLKDLPVVFTISLVTWTPIVIFIFIFPALWGLKNAFFSLDNFKASHNLLQSSAVHLFIVAIPEEFFYRGYLLGRFDEIFTSRKKILGVETGPGLYISSLLFAIGHFIIIPEPSRLLVFFPSLVFGWLKYRQKDINSSVMYHGGSNIFMNIFRTGLGL